MDTIYFFIGSSAAPLLACITLIWYIYSSTNDRIDTISRRVNSVEKQYKSIYSCVEEIKRIITEMRVEMADRLARLEEKIK